jgi:hypothetical protein
MLSSARVGGWSGGPAVRWSGGSAVRWLVGLIVWWWGWDLRGCVITITHHDRNDALLDSPLVINVKKRENDLTVNGLVEPFLEHGGGLLGDTLVVPGGDGGW